MSKTLTENRRFTPGRIGALGFGILYSIGAAAYSLSIGNTEFIFYVVVMVIAGMCVGVVHWRAHLSTGLFWALAVWGLAHMAGGLVHVGGDADVLYNVWLFGSSNGRGLKFDQLVHAYGFGVSTWLCWECLQRVLRDPRPRVAPLTLCVLGGEGLGAINEIVEFTATQIMPKTNVGDYANNSWDLVFNLAGCIIAAVLILVGGRKGAEER